MLLAGEIGKPHGTSGEVYVVRISDDPRRFEIGAELTHEDGRKLVVATCRAHRNRFLVRFDGIDSREEAEAIRGALYVDPADARALEDTEYWEYEIVGSTVALTDGTQVGQVSDVIVRPAQDLLEVTTQHGPRLVPFVDEIVVQVDRAARRVVIDPPAGLLD